MGAAGVMVSLILPSHGYREFCFTVKRFCFRTVVASLETNRFTSKPFGGFEVLFMGIDLTRRCNSGAEQSGPDSVSMQCLLFEDRLVVLRICAPGRPSISILLVANEELRHMSILLPIRFADVVTAVLNPKLSKREVSLLVHRNGKLLLEIRLFLEEQIQLHQGFFRQGVARDNIFLRRRTH